MIAKRASRERIRYAVVGLGHIAQVAVLPAFANTPNSELVTIVSGDEEKRKKLSRKYHLQNVYSYDDYERALCNVDAVYISVPNHLHKEYAVRAADVGVQVLCEKPMAPTEAECQEMIDAAARNAVKLMIAYRLHFEAGNLEAIKLARQQKLGELRFFTSEFAQQVAKGNVRVSESSERGGGPLYDMGVYCINAARYLFGAHPVEAAAFATANSQDERFKNTEEMTSAILRFPENRIATFTCSFGATDISRYTVVGSRGLLIADPAYEYAEAIEHQLKIGGKTKTRKFLKRDQFAAEIAYFSKCIIEDKQPEPSGLEGLADIRVIEALRESVRTGKAVPIPALPATPGPSPDQEIHRPSHDKPETVRALSPSGEAA